MARNKYITELNVEAIVNIIRGWANERITWEQVCDESESILGYRPSRQGLSSHSAILHAFQSRKSGLILSPPKKTPLPSSLKSAAHRISAKDAEIFELKRRIDQLNMQFSIWLYNINGRLTIEQLNKPLPVIDRR